MITDWLSEPFIQRAVIAGIGVAVVAGPLGCFVVWRKMAYFGDSLAHSALLGIALGLLLGTHLNLSTLLVCMLFASVLVWMQQRQRFATDTLLGILAHGALAFGTIALSLLNTPAFDLHAWLFGDVLTVSAQDIIWILGGSALVLIIIAYYWGPLVLATLGPELAQAEGVNTYRLQWLLTILMTVVVAVSLRVVGILMITSLLIIPAATAGLLARSPSQMAVLASLTGSVAVLSGIGVSSLVDTPSGPSIVAAAVVLFVLALPISTLVKQ